MREKNLCADRRKIADSVERERERESRFTRREKKEMNREREWRRV